MRVIRAYRFRIGTKIPFGQWPEIVHRYLEEQGLSSRRFLYRFSEYVHEPEVQPKAYGRLKRDCPEIGEARCIPTAVSGMSEWVLTNIADEADFPAERLLPLMGRIQRTYGFAQAALSCWDVNFFGGVIPCELEGDPYREGTWKLHGSGITMYRDAVFGDAELEMCIDVLRDGCLLDASAYCEAMQQLLPKIRVESTMKIVLTEAERQHAAQISQAAEPMLERCRVFFQERMPERWTQTFDAARYSLATAMKKLAKRYGYAYSMVWSGGMFGLAKRTERGHVVFITADAGPSRTRTEFSVYLQGIGFNHCLSKAGFAPVTQAELEAVLEQAMDCVAEFEQTLLPAADALFPECPAWFEPSARA
ncbi:MAG: hypothetical protein IJ343_12250 [Clostridia bacterium]|nr:hypothetical protein [Clostridia bacterium]